MAHKVKSVMYVGDAQWHGLGVHIPDGKKLSIEEAIAAAGLDWDGGTPPYLYKGWKGESLWGYLTTM